MPDPAPAPGRWEIRRLAEVDSTNRVVLDEARAGAPEGLVVVADHQTAGHGRLDRRWDAPAGSSLLVSVLLRPPLAVERAPLAGSAAALAVAEAVEAVCAVPTQLKWPNDVLVGERKLAGVLAERASGDGANEAAVVVGVGCNVNRTSFPPELEATATSCQLEVGTAIDRDELLCAFLDALARRVDDFDGVPSAYQARLATLGRRVRVERLGGAMEGVATGVDPRGALVVRAYDGTTVVCSVADVVHLFTV